MRDLKLNSHAERAQAAAEAKKALLEKFKPKPAVTVDLEAVKAAREAEREAKRRAHAEAKEQARLAQEAAREAARLAELEKQREALALKRGAIKERKALSKAEQRARKQDRLAAFSSMARTSATGG
ncbi:MAG: DUF6481 family protein [Pseudomonadota bacterium]|nr:DUF6481 family protein [Pseudomonadota bacterium]